jgi:signal transduction histidine kinase
LTTLERPGPADVGASIEEVVAILRQRFDGVKIESICDGTDNGVATIAGGGAAMRRVLATVGSNACEGDGAATASRVTLRASFDIGAGVVQITVSDDGPGIPESVLSRVWRGYSAKMDGTGVGLAVVHNIVEASGGTLHLANQDAGGARVTITLPTIGH